MQVLVAHFPYNKPLGPECANDLFLPACAGATFEFLGIQRVGIVEVLNLTPFVAETAEEQLIPSNFVLTCDQSLQRWSGGVGERDVVGYLRLIRSVRCLLLR